jgi:peroxiredoxin
LSRERSGALPLLLASGLFALLIGALALLRVPPGAGARVGSPAPDFALRNLGGESIALQEQRGSVVFVNFWATWCPPCRDEAPSLQRLYGRLHEEGFEILAVSIDAPGQGKAVEEFRREFGLSFPILLDPAKDAHAAFGVTGVPETYLIDASGRLAERFIGPRNWDDPRYARVVRRLLAERDAGAERRDG